MGFSTPPRTVAPSIETTGGQTKLCLWGPGPVQHEPVRKGREQNEKRFWKMWVKWSGTWWLLVASFPPVSCQLIDFNDVSEQWPVPLPPGSPCPLCPPRKPEWQRHTNKAPHGTDWELLKFSPLLLFTYSLVPQSWRSKKVELPSTADNLEASNVSFTRIT